LRGARLKVEDLWVSIDGKEILKRIDLHLPQGETHVLFGKNGSGKSTLLMTIMGFSVIRQSRGRFTSKAGTSLTRLPMSGPAWG